MIDQTTTSERKTVYSLPVGDGTIYFDSAEDQDRYIKEERKYCRAELIQRFKAVSPDIRKRAETKLNQKRIEFARLNRKFGNNVQRGESNDTA